MRHFSFPPKSTYMNMEIYVVVVVVVVVVVLVVVVVVVAVDFINLSRISSA